MKVGKISESVLKRSVLKQINSINDEMKNGAGVGSDCAVFSYAGADSASAVATFFLCSPEEIRYPIIKAANNVACSGAVPKMMLLSVLLPEETEEKELADMMRAAQKTAKKMQIQIAGGHTEVSKQLKKPCVTVMLNGVLESEKKEKKKVKPGDDIVMSKWVGLEGTAILAGRYEQKLALRYPLHMIEEAAGYKRYLSIVPEAATAEKSNVGMIHDVSTGGIFAALWELAESAGVGLTIDLKKIPIKQETIEVCEFFGISPYELLSGGSLLMTTNKADELIEVLEAQGIPAAVIGKITDSNDRVVINDDERRFLERPKADEITKIQEETE